ncbi:hypothetical protein SLA2020_373310 [Shorea laevis]
MEVATAIGTTALSVSLEWLIKYLGSKSSGWWNSRSQVRDDLQNWKSFLPKLCAVLDDAEMRQTTNLAVELWLSDLRDVAYDMEDVLDGLEADERRKKLTAKTDQPSTSKARKLIPMCCTGFNQDDLILDHEAVSKIKEISVRLERIVREKEALDLKVGETRSSIAAPRWEPITPTTWLPEPHVYGREGDKDAILQKVLNDEDGDENPCVIPIVGMGGLGKTTLARLVYNDARLKDVFERKAWVCVSDEFDILRITRSILEQITQSKCDSEDPSVLQGKVNRELSGKKFLFVFDDVWSVEDHCWDVLQRVFLSAAVGSKIIVTSRIEGVAKTMGASDRIYHLKLLPEDQCLSLLARRALGRENFDAHLKLKDIGVEIVKRCKGLPLAIKTLGGLLRGELNPDKWVKVLKSEMWELPEGRSHILPALRLSYHHLPAHLKKCFVYCAIFPKDHEFCKDDLILLWMAEGFVKQQQNGARQIKDMGDQYFCDLISRGLFQQSSNNQSYFVMHDLVHDLAEYVAGETCCNLENMIESEKMEVSFEKARHASCFTDGVLYSKISWFLQKPNNLRTFLVLSPDYEQFSVDEFYQELIKRLRCPRVLSLKGWKISDPPNSIEKLKHLRYIDLSYSALKSLPSSVSSLVYLQTLKLYRCKQISELPVGIVDLVDLHHLDIRGTDSLQKMPPLMGNLKNLLMLPKFIVGESDGLRLKELSNLKDLRGELLIKDLHNVSDIQDASKANLFKIEGLEELTLAWTDDFQTSRDESNELQVLSQLKPHSNLKRFKIDSYGGLEFPSWIGDPSFSNLEYLRLNNCKRSTLLPRGGKLPQLMQLEICGCLQLTYSPMSLPSLQKLYLHDCKEAVLRSVFDSTSLTELYINRISELTCLPRSIMQNMTALETLEICQCGELTFLLEDGDCLSCFSNLKKMYITDCPLLESLTDGLPLTLETLIIHHCDNLECLPNGLHSLTSLKKLDIQNCKKFVGFPVTDFPLHLQRLLLNNLEALESLPDELMMTTEKLEIYECPCLKSISTGELLARPEESTVENSEKSEFLRKGDDSSTVTVNPERTSISGMGKPNFPIDCMHNLSRLCYLDIVDCKSLESLPERLLSTSTLKTLTISGCGNLKSLPNGMYNCTSLQQLYISNCPGIASINAGGGLPPNLKSLEIDCEGLKQSMLEWGLDRLTSLEKFQIHWICPLDDLLPTSLKTLKIKRVGNLESISKGLLQNLASLRELTFNDCPNLKTLPKEGLPPLLEVFEIKGCPLLEQRCLEEEGDYWPLISNIREINIPSIGPKIPLTQSRYKNTLPHPQHVLHLNLNIEICYYYSLV